VPRPTGTHELLLERSAYWVALFELLGERGFEVKLVDSRQLKNAPACKTVLVTYRRPKAAVRVLGPLQP
jgi:transposase